jgi:hypothetical protein
MDDTKNEKRPKAASPPACRCSNCPFSRILKVNIEWRANSREIKKKDSGTARRPFQNRCQLSSSFYIVIAALTLVRATIDLFSLTGVKPASIRYISVSHTSLEPVPTTCPFLSWST